MFQVLRTPPQHCEVDKSASYILTELFCSFPFVLQVQTAVEQHTIDARFLLKIAGGRALCGVAEQLIDYALDNVSTALNGHSRQFYSTRIFHTMARLDVPTWNDPAVTGQINALSPASYRTAAWGAIETFVDTGSSLLRMFSQAVVLFDVLKGQRDGQLLALLSFVSDLVSYLDGSDTLYLGRSMEFMLYVNPR
jgi:hypothetical protein